MVPLALVQVLTIPWVLHPVELLLHLVEEIEEIVSQAISPLLVVVAVLDPVFKVAAVLKLEAPLLTLTLVTS